MLTIAPFPAMTHGTGGTALKRKGAVHQAQWPSNLPSADTHHPTGTIRGRQARVDCYPRWHFKRWPSLQLTGRNVKCHFGLKIYLSFQQQVNNEIKIDSNVQDMPTTKASGISVCHTSSTF